MAIKLDVSACSVVVYCDACGHWAAFAWTRAEAEATAIRHEENVHPESFASRKREASRGTTRRYRQQKSAM